MTDSAKEAAPPLAHSYNLARLSNAGEVVRFEADEAQRAAIAQLSRALAVARFAVTVSIRKSAVSLYALDYRVEAEVTQACVVTLEPVPAVIDRSFTRELHFAGTGRREPISAAAELDLSAMDLSSEDDDEPEEIESLHIDLGAPAVEEYLLALDPYPRCPGVEFTPPAPEAPPESPFAVLKSLKSST